MFRFTEVNSAKKFFKRKKTSTDKREVLRAIGSRKGSKRSAFGERERMLRGNTVKNSGIDIRRF
ncbi:MAG: hypothetical protein B7C55_09280 [Actinomycetales bacterium mxb001]|nr:MAG: hypothetical protein B7C55_09280 [Actinomycetales bacterium mxb001]